MLTDTQAHELGTLRGQAIGRQISEDCLIRHIQRVRTQDMWNPAYIEGLEFACMVLGIKGWREEPKE
jgi:hypothetical protein